MCRRRRLLASVVLAVVVGFSAGEARAGNNGFFTTYNSEIDEGEFELMFMNDMTSPSKFRKAEGQGDYLSHMIELEYGVTSQFATEFMVEWFEDLKTAERKFTGFRWESRYRLFEDPVPLNPMVYVEYEDLSLDTRYKMEVSGWINPPYEEGGEEPDRERIAETRLVLSEKIGGVDVAFNWINETDLENGTTAFGYALGAMWMPGGGHGGHSQAHAGEGHARDCPAHAASGSAAGTAPPQPATGGGCTCEKDMPGCGCSHCAGRGGECECGHAGAVGFGLELFGALGDTEAFDLEPTRQEHYLGPILMYHVTSRLMVHSQLAIGLSKASDNLVRLNFGYEF